MLLSAKKHFYLLLIICIIVLSSSIVIRTKYNSGLFMGNEAYSSLRTAEYIHNTKQIPKEDSLSYGGRPYVNEYGWPVLLSISPQILGKYLPLILGIISFILFYMILTILNKEIRGIASLFLILSPGFIYLFSTPLKYAIATLLILLGIYLLLKEKDVAAIIVIGITGFFSIITLALITALFAIYSVKKRKWETTTYLILSLILTFIIQFYRILFIGMPEKIFAINFSLPSLINLLISDFGSKLGFSIFTLFLGLIGIYKYGKTKYKFLLYYLILIIILYTSFYFNFIILYIGFVISFFAALGFNSLLKNDWRSNTLRQFTILVVICGIIFSGISFLNNAHNLNPTKGFSEAFTFLKNQNNTNMVFSHYTRGDYISYAGRINFMDNNVLYARNVDSRLKDSEKLLHAKNLHIATSIINKHNIRYILLDKELIENIWGKRETELILFLRYSKPNFQKIFDNGDVEIYEYIRKYNSTINL